MRRAAVFRKTAVRAAALSLALLAGGCTRGCGATPTAPVTGMRVAVSDAENRPVQSRVSIFPAAAPETGYARPVTAVWAPAATDGVLVVLPPGAYRVRAQGTGDSFLETEATVREGELTGVRLGFGSLVLEGTALRDSGRVRIRQFGPGVERIVVTRRLRPAETARLALGEGSYRISWLPDRLADEDANWTPVAEFQLRQGHTEVVHVGR